MQALWTWWSGLTAKTQLTLMGTTAAVLLFLRLVVSRRRAREMCEAEAIRRIEQCIERGDDALDLGGLQLAQVPQELMTYAQNGALKALKQLYLGGDASARESPKYGAFGFRNKERNRLKVLPSALLNALQQLTELDLAHNYHLTMPEGICSLIALTSLNLNGNYIGDEGVAHLAGLTTLTSLNLRRNNIGDKGAKHLTGLTALTSLDLEDNHIGDKGAKHLTKLTALTSLNLRRNLIEDKSTEPDPVVVAALAAMDLGVVYIKDKNADEE